MVVDIPQSDMVRMEQILKDEKAHTVDSPGEWKGLEDTHIPVVTKNGDGSVVVQVRVCIAARDQSRKNAEAPWFLLLPVCLSCRSALCQSSDTVRQYI